MPGTKLPVGYVSSNPDGDDGRPISDYDVIGSATRRSGLFALEDVDELAFVYIPPLARAIDIGASALLVAARFCREHRAMLIVDPPAIVGQRHAMRYARLKALNFHSDNALMFFPRIVGDGSAAWPHRSVRQRRCGRGHAVALGRGRLGGRGRRRSRSRCCAPNARLAREVSAPIAGCWRRMASTCCRRSAVPIANGRRCGHWPAARARLRTGPTLRSAASRCSSSTPSSAARAGAWSRRATAACGCGSTRQIRTFLEELRSAGAFAAVPADQAYLVICDERINDAADEPHG